MTLKSPDDVQEFQENLQKDMQEKISNFGERCEEYWDGVMEIVHGSEEE